MVWWNILYISLLSIFSSFFSSFSWNLSHLSDWTGGRDSLMLRPLSTTAVTWTSYIYCGRVSTVARHVIKIVICDVPASWTNDLNRIVGNLIYIWKPLLSTIVFFTQIQANDKTGYVITAIGICSAKRTAIGICSFKRTANALPAFEMFAYPPLEKPHITKLA